MKINNSKCLIIAEIGLNHNGDYQLACDSVVAAANSGADAVKFQNFETEDFLTDRSILHSYKQNNEWITEPLFDICKRSEFRFEWMQPIKKLCDDLGVILMSTPTSERGVDELINHGVKFIKNGSDYLTHLPLLIYMAKTDAKIIISTGMANKQDIDDAVDVICKHRHDSCNLIILHCTSNYPTTDENVNLLRMVSLKERYNLSVGFSDHTEGWISAVQAVTLGAEVIEKHFTLDKCLPGPDHWFSSNPLEFSELVSQVRSAEVRMGSNKIKPSVSEIEARKQWRLGLVWNNDIDSGSVIMRSDVSIKKPAKGLLPKDLDRVIGKKLVKNCLKGRSIQIDDLSL
jgi:N,N'-diacetyllegionaminate synthase